MVQTLSGTLDWMPQVLGLCIQNPVFNASRHITELCWNKCNNFITNINLGACQTSKSLFCGGFLKEKNFYILVAVFAQKVRVLVAEFCIMYIQYVVKHEHFLSTFLIIYCICCAAEEFAYSILCVVGILEIRFLQIALWEKISILFPTMQGNEAKFSRIAQCSFRNGEAIGFENYL